MSARPADAREASPAIRAAAAVSRHAAVYAAGSGLGLVLSVVNAIVLTRYLEPADFGRLGLALVAASLLTIALNAPIGHGALLRTFGATDDDPDDAAPAAPPELARRSFGSALAVTSLVGTGVTLVASLPCLAVLDRDAAGLVALTGLSGTSGALWRLLSAVPRLQRRPVAYVSLATLRPVAVLALSLPLVAHGAGIPGAIAGVAVGTLAANLVAGVVTRSTFTLAMDRDELRMMRRRSRPLLPLIAGGWIIQNVDLYIVAAFASAADLGHYRLASRLGAIGAYGTSAFLAAWGPLELSAAFRESDRAHGRQALRGALLFQFLLWCLLLVLALAVLADELVRVAPRAYADAAGLIALLGIAFVAQGVLTALYRAGWFEAKARMYRRGTFYASLVFLPLACGLVIVIGAAGAAIAAAVVFSGLCVALVRTSHRENRRFGLPRGRLVCATALAAILYVASAWTQPEHHSVELAVHLAAPLFFLLAMPLFWPAAHRRSFRPLLRALGSRRLTGIRD